MLTRQQAGRRAILVAAVIAVLLAVISTSMLVKEIIRPGRPPEPAAQKPLQVSITGDCNANGNDNTIHCKPGPTLANVEVSEDFDEFYLWFDGAPETLPVPPPALAGHGHCRDEGFVRWLRSTEGFHFLDIHKVVVLTSGDPDLVSLRRAATVVTSRESVSPGDGTWIKCQWGGGGLTQNFHIDLDTQAVEATLSDVGEVSGFTDPRPMPPAVVSLGGRKEAIISFAALSKRGHVYSGHLMLTTAQNAKSVVLSIGSPEAPLRWAELGGPAEGEDYYALDDNGRWSRNWSPF
ncbi:hypothetical protein [Actinoplanes utahensis]|uniref:Uncharacterized protein n=1 Tax=Actinoplanes utahensis TaxID=1869 RepID=A0A0A6ULX7_ACTUT|nr:hypothetical protein [Actinoplanes utahensis]KHD76431.1 hypothetical protein MB27_17125 [Actinoplanes utahensis]GIF29788.1 hypothetical protein Aut01nite_27740 [Actinoplanes utahensis]